MSVGEVKYLESENLKIVPVYSGLSIDKFLVVGITSGETTAEFKTLYDAEHFILSNKKIEVGRIVFDSAAEFKSH